MRTGEGIRYKHFPIMNDEWLDFVVYCRASKNNQHDYDVVEGPMADDAIYTKISDFMDGLIPRELFWAYMRFEHPTHQICLCTEKALENLEYTGCYSIEEINGSWVKKGEQL